MKKIGKGLAVFLAIATPLTYAGSVAWNAGIGNWAEDVLGDWELFGITNKTLSKQIIKTFAPEVQQGIIDCFGENNNAALYSNLQHFNPSFEGDVSLIGMRYGVQFDGKFIGELKFDITKSGSIFKSFFRDTSDISKFTLRLDHDDPDGTVEAVYKAAIQSLEKGKYVAPEKFVPGISSGEDLFGFIKNNAKTIGSISDQRQEYGVVQEITEEGFTYTNAKLAKALAAVNIEKRLAELYNKTDPDSIKERDKKLAELAAISNGRVELGVFDVENASINKISQVKQGTQLDSVNVNIKTPFNAIVNTGEIIYQISGLMGYMQNLKVGEGEGYDLTVKEAYQSDSIVAASLISNPEKCLTEFIKAGHESKFENGNLATAFDIEGIKVSVLDTRNAEFKDSRKVSFKMDVHSNGTYSIILFDGDAVKGYEQMKFAASEQIRLANKILTTETAADVKNARQNMPQTKSLLNQFVPELSIHDKKQTGEYILKDGSYNSMRMFGEVEMINGKQILNVFDYDGEPIGTFVNGKQLLEGQTVDSKTGAILNPLVNRGIKTPNTSNLKTDMISGRNMQFYLEKKSGNDILKPPGDSKKNGLMPFFLLHFNV